MGRTEAKGAQSQDTQPGLEIPVGLRGSFIQAENRRTSINKLLGVKEGSECSKKREAVPRPESIKNEGLTKSSR